MLSQVCLDDCFVIRLHRSVPFQCFRQAAVRGYLGVVFSHDVHLPAWLLSADVVRVINTSDFDHWRGVYHRARFASWVAPS